ncbi:MAG TPA: sulfurtransferase TusA family protein [Gammaproteobacteria bacterium]|nr:sulfurtransferase TusA family protein [Gammaproteobacteria bacterium]
MSHLTLDARRLLCPLPVIRLQKKIQGLQAGDILTITCTDPGAEQDIPAWCRLHGHTILKTKTNRNETSITLQISQGLSNASPG